MVLNKFLTISLLLLISTQLLPVKELGSILYGNRMVEEVFQSTDMEELKKNEFYFHHTGSHYAVIDLANSKVQAYSLAYASRLSDDPPTLPPL
jgi:hypothetical protein